jgi:radical SAM superfamily enzyme YgiQ (UPF0313 family)
LPAPAYHLVDPGIYAAVSGTRQLAYTSSVGCPYQCNYCTDQVFYKRRFNAYRVERVVSDLAELVPRYKIEHVPFFDSNFLVDRKRAVAVAKGIVDRPGSSAISLGSRCCEQRDLSKMCLFTVSGATRRTLETMSPTGKALSMILCSLLECEVQSLALTR